MGVNHHSLTYWPVFSSTQLIKQMTEVTNISLLLIRLFLKYFQLYFAEHFCSFQLDINQKVFIACIDPVLYAVDFELITG
jgi:hypothetical protein